jgi:hypothetical protein
VRVPSVQEDKAITAAARNDQDALPPTPTPLKAMVTLKNLRGRPQSENKKQWVSARAKSPMPGRSTLMTRAPKSASCRVQNGAAIACSP